MRIFLTKIMMLASLALTLLAFSQAPAAAAFDPFGDTCTNAAADASAVCSDSATEKANGNVNPVYHTIHVAADIIALIGGIVGVITIMVSGLNYVTSGGEQEKIKKAKTRIFGAVIGLAILALAYTITTFGVNLVK